jgi:predicted short-subunit dehydrogenase-like oxidoreductase (DUF2520 family)
MDRIDDKHGEYPSLPHKRHQADTGSIYPFSGCHLIAAPTFAPEMSSILLVGTGRAAFHLGHAFLRAGLRIPAIVGRQAEHTRRLAERLGTQAIAFGEPLPACDLRLLAVSDDAIAEVAALLPPSAEVTAHTSGTLSLDLLGDHAHRGVFWPIQSLAVGEPIAFDHVPLVLDAEDEQARALLRGVAEQVSDTVVEVPFQQRQVLHLAAVLSGNFPVALLQEARRLLTKNGLSPDLVLPLWETTTAKAAHDPEGALTGPARRGDMGTIRAHLERSADEPDLRRAYAALSDLILQAYHPEKRERKDL